MEFMVHQVDVINLKNIGPEKARWLKEIGVYTRADLEEMGAVLAYKILKHRYAQRVNIMALYALQGALLDMHWNHLPTDLKEALSQEVAGSLDVRHRSS